MPNRGTVLFLATIVLASCAIVPEFPPETKVRVRDVVQRVECEIQQTIERNNKKLPKLKSWPIGYTLTLRVDTEVGATASADWTIPYHLTDTFTYSASPGLSGTSLREGSFTFLYDPKKTYKCPADLGGTSASEMFGSFGIQEWIEGVAIANGGSRLSEASTFGYTIKFAVAAIGNGKPGFKIVNMTGTVGLSGKRTDTNTLVIAVVKARGDQKAFVTDTPRLNQQLDLLRLRDLLRP